MLTRVAIALLSRWVVWPIGAGRGQQPASSISISWRYTATHHRIAALKVQLGGLALRQGHVLVEVCTGGLFPHHIDDLHTPGAVRALAVKSPPVRHSFNPL